MALRLREMANHKYPDWGDKKEEIIFTISDCLPT